MQFMAVDLTIIVFNLRDMNKSLHDLLSVFVHDFGIFWHGLFT